MLTAVSWADESLLAALWLVLDARQPVLSRRRKLDVPAGGPGHARATKRAVLMYSETRYCTETTLYQNVERAGSSSVPPGGSPCVGRDAQSHAVGLLVALLDVRDQVGNRGEHQAVLLAEGAQLRRARHRAVVVANLAQHARLVEACQPAEIDGRLGVAVALQHTWSEGGRDIRE